MFGSYRFQSTRPRGRTRLLCEWFDPSFEVSIHASSREDATTLVIDGEVFIRFQSTRPRGRTRLPVFSGTKISYCFNPRVLAGGRDADCIAKRIKRSVSIHASSREDATRLDYMHDATEQFQSTRPRGRTRPVSIVINIFMPVFQSTRPRGRTRQRCAFGGRF